MSQPNDGTMYEVAGDAPVGNGTRMAEVMNKAMLLGNHVWIMTAVYSVDPEKMTPGATTLMDHESLLSIAGPGCLVCEQEHSKRTSLRRCPGLPRRIR